MNAPEKFDDTVPPELAKIVADCLGVSVEQLAREVHARRDAARRRVERNNARFAQALRSMSAAQALVVAQHEQQGYKVGKLLVSRNSDRSVAVLMQKRPVWDPRKNKMGGKLVMVYPNMPMIVETFERTISIRRDF